MMSHAAGRGSEQPTPAQLKELFAQIESGRINRSRMQQFLRGSTQVVTTEIAREVMGEKNFFGSQEWVKFFGKTFSLLKVPDIHWSQTALENPVIDQKHFLFLGLKYFGGELLNLPKWHRIFSNKKRHPTLCLDWYLSHEFAKKTCEFRWYLMPIGIVIGSTGLSCAQQEVMLPLDNYEVPSAIERVSANILYYLLNKKYLDTGYWVRTSDVTDVGNRVRVQGDSDVGLSVGYWGGVAVDYIGVSASRKS